MVKNLDLSINPPFPPSFVPTHLILSPVMPRPSCASTISAAAPLPPDAAAARRSYSPMDPAKEPAA